MEWHPAGRADAMLPAWSASGGLTISLDSIVASDASVLFGVAAIGSTYEVMAWDSSAGAHVLRGFASLSEGGACCPQTDGQDLVWLESTQHHPATGGAPDTFADVWLYTSPYATSAQALQPRPVRQISQDILLGASFLVGGGYVAQQEFNAGANLTKLTLTRLSDGAYWVIAPPSGFTVGAPLYVDAEEFAYVKNAGSALFVDAGLQSGESWSIVRQTISALGPPLPADAGP